MNIPLDKKLHFGAGVIISCLFGWAISPIIGLQLSIIAGLDAFRYGLLCYDEWDATPAERDEQGNITEPAKPAGNRYSLRYEEALCMEAAYQRRRADRLEARIEALERAINHE
jgi:hypothetical protein